MKFNLKTMLFVVCTLGATIGVMGKLLTETPETFFQILDIAVSVAPFVLATGTIIWLGLKRTPAAATNDKAEANEIDKRRWRLVAWGVVLLVWPLVSIGITSYLWPNRNPLAVLSTQRLIQQRLPGKINEPWVWNELTNRLNKRALSQAEVEQALNELIAFMKKTSPKGWNQPLPWQNTFLKAAIGGSMVSTNVLNNLCDAFFGPGPIIQSRPIVARVRKPIALELYYGNPWVSGTGLDVELLWTVKEVRVDGTLVKFQQVNRQNDHWYGSCANSLEPGDDEMSIDVECAYIDRGKLAGMNALTLPVDKWPMHRMRWSAMISAPLKVEGLELK
jgi:hypothetical protein